ncbi:UNVERIFIED_CONTAM: hypothetical protein HDU68_000417 [Siphonaria sp. JEL0065]|nr:hypothetical protein HDU68_000417 [Siphonaria sp. JEL0065]
MSPVEYTRLRAWEVALLGFLRDCVSESEFDGKWRVLAVLIGTVEIDDIGGGDVGTSYEEERQDEEGNESVKNKDGRAEDEKVKEEEKSDGASAQDVETEESTSSAGLSVVEVYGIKPGTKLSEVKFQEQLKKRKKPQRRMKKRKRRKRMMEQSRHPHFINTGEAARKKERKKATTI